MRTTYRSAHDTASPGFTCAACGRTLSGIEYGGRHRNHCPHCLCSVHLDKQPGDRAAHCGGIMKPIGIHVQANGEWSVIHKCSVCGTVKLNRIAHDDNEVMLVTLAAKPLMSLPFPSKRVLSELQRLSMSNDMCNDPDKQR